MNVLKAIVTMLIAVALIMTTGTIIEDNKAISISYLTEDWVTPKSALVNTGSVSAGSRSVDSAVDSGVTDIALASQISNEFNINDPYIEEQWALSKIRLCQAWQVTLGNPAIMVAILDTGVDWNHVDLDYTVLSAINFTDSHTSSDIIGHGTHVAGIIAANNNNGLGITGVAPESKILNVKVADDKGRCSALAVANGIKWAVDNGASIINISIEIREASSDLADAIEYAWCQGALIITAAGNGASSVPVYPAYYENSISVAAITENDSLAPLSNFGDWVDVAAPGFNIYSTLPGDSYGYKTGTSFATAYVSGAAALLFSVATDMNENGRLNDEVRTALETGCHELQISGVGKGRIDITKSLSEIGHIP